MYYFNDEVIKILASEGVILSPSEIKAYIRVCNQAQGNFISYKTKKNRNEKRRFSVFHTQVSDNDPTLNHWFMLPGRQNWATKDPEKKLITTKLFVNLVTGKKIFVKIRRPVTKFSATHLIDSVSEANNNRLMKIPVEHYTRYSLEKGTKSYLFQPYRGKANMLDYLEDPQTTSKELLNMLLTSGLLLEKMHQKGFLHIDFKPQNVVLSDDKKNLTLLDLEFMMSTASGEKGKKYIQGTKAFAHPDWLDHSMLSRANGDLVYYKTQNDVYAFLITAEAFLTQAHHRESDQQLKLKIRESLGQINIWKRGPFSCVPQMSEVINELRNISKNPIRDKRSRLKI